MCFIKVRSFFNLRSLFYDIKYDSSLLIRAIISVQKVLEKLRYVFSIAIGTNNKIVIKSLCNDFRGMILSFNNKIR